VEALSEFKLLGVTADDCDPVYLRRELLNKQNMGPILGELQSSQCPEWKIIADRSLTHKRYWAKLKFLAAGNDILECHLESAVGSSK
jgi:hypothetical protein